MPDTENREKRQAELLSAAIDNLNQGLPLDDVQEDEEFAEMLSTVSLIKTATPLAPPPAVLLHIVEESAQAIAREKRKKRLYRVLAGCTGVAAAAAVAAFLYIMPPTTQELQMAKQPQPSPTAEPPQPAVITNPPPSLAELSSAPEEKPVPAADTKVVQAETPPSEPSPSVALGLPAPTTPAKTETMLALADRKADSVTIDSVSNTIRQIYRKGAPDEIILTQAPKRAEVLQSIEPSPPGIQAKRAVVREKVDMKIKAPDRNKVTVTVGDKEVTLEGALSREELLKLADTMINVNISQ